MTKPMERIVLAFSEGLESAVAIPWLAERYGAEVVAVTIDLGQGRELEDSDFQRRRPVCVIGSEVAEALFPRIDPVGQSIKASGFELLVVGTLVARGAMPCLGLFSLEECMRALDKFDVHTTIERTLG